MLADAANTLVHPAPAPVVVKVAADTALVRSAPAAGLARESAVALHLERIGVEATRSSREMPSGVHVCHGLPMTFWEHLPHDRSLVADVRTGRVELALLHEALDDLVIPLPRLAPLDDITGFLEGRGSGHPRRAQLESAYRRLLPDVLGTDRVLHGDAHRGNLLAGPRGWAWCDLEDACRGPAEWDLVALDGVTSGSPTRELRRLHLTCWYALHAARDPRHAARAAELAASWD